MKLSVYKGIARPEYNIQPPMKAAITIPVLFDGVDEGVAVYVASTPFVSTHNLDRIREVAARIHAALKEAP